MNLLRKFLNRSSDDGYLKEAELIINVYPGSRHRVNIILTTRKAS